MVVDLREFDSATEIVKAVDHEITETKNTLNGHLRRLEDIRALAEKSKRIREIVSKIAGKRTIIESGEVSIGGIGLILDAKSAHELVAIEEVVRSQQEKLVALQRAREGLKWTDQIGETEGVKFLVLEKDGVPVKILLRFMSEL
jgi:hypothetical protein